MIYLDASALVTHITRRAYAAALHEFLREHPDLPMGTSTIGLIETVRTCDRIGNYPDLMTHLLSDFTEVLVTGETRDRAAYLPGTLRSLDAIHIASAQEIGDALTALVTYDRRMLDAATAAGLPVASPGMD